MVAKPEERSSTFSRTGSRPKVERDAPSTKAPSNFKDKKSLLSKLNIAASNSPKVNVTFPVLTNIKSHDVEQKLSDPFDSTIIEGFGDY